MRAMKDSGVEWLGEVPAGWGLHRGKRLFRLTNDRGNDDLTLLAATQKYGMWPQSRLEGVVRVKEDTDLSTFRTVHKNDFVISLRSFQGGFERSDFEGVCSPAYQTFCATKPINHQYFKYLFKSPSFIDHMNSLTLGIREGKTIKYDDFAVQKLPVPPVEEQARIADFLDAKCAEVDRAVSAAEQSIQEYKAYLSSLVDEAFSSAADYVKLARISTLITDGDHQAPARSDCGIPFLVISNISKGYISFEDTDFVTKEYYETIPVVHRAQKGDLLVSVTGSYGIPVLVDTDERFCFQRHIALVRPTIDPAYVRFAMLTSGFRSYCDGVVTGAAQKTLTLTALRAARIPRMDAIDEARLVEFLTRKETQINEAIAAKQAIIDELKSYKQSLIYEAVTGKLEV